METTAPAESLARLAAALKDKYRVERALGAGGMATVYLAEDLKHSRKVAIKVLKPELAAVLGAERFLTEIKTTANLQHPHILPLFDSGEADTFLYYVMPFVEGESLRDRLDRDRQLGVDDAVRIARDVADALDYAHRHGVIHRDIKPANILLHDGRPLVADFGIALAISAAGGGRLTETGLSLGTPHYMSPEQASAERDLSARSDVYSLGCVLYEMLAGEPPHTGPNAASILMRILTEQPRPISALRATVPPHVAGAVTKAVEKLPADRFETAKEFRDALEDPSFRFTRVTAAVAAPETVPGTPARARAWDGRHAVLAGMTVLLAVATAWLALRERTPAATPPAVIAFEVSDSGPIVVDPVAGPNGWLAYARGGRLHVRAPGSLASVPLVGAEATNDLSAFSPDGEFIVYVQFSGGTGSTLRKIPARGGTPVPLVSTPAIALRPYWSTDGWIYFSAGPPGSWAIVRVPENGGAVDTLFKAGAFIPYHLTQPAGRAALVFALFNANAVLPRLIALDLKSRDTTEVLDDGYQPEWSETGHLLFARGQGTLFAVPFDARKLRATGPAVSVLDSLSEAFPTARFDLSPSGTLAYMAGPSAGRGGNFSLILDNLSGGRQKIPLPPSDHWDAKFSPDGRRLAYIRADQVWTYDLDLGTHTQITREGARHHNPAWSPDGQLVAFSASVTDRQDVDVYVADASGKSVERFGGSTADDYPSQWVGDSAVLVYTQGSNQDIGLVRRGADMTPLLRADWVERNPRISPDGRWLAYVSSESGRDQLQVRRWPALTSRTVVSEGDVSVAANSFPLWSNDGRTLYYLQGQRIIAATVDGSTDSLRLTSRRVAEDSVTGNLQDIHPDGRRFLVLGPEAEAPSRSVTGRRRLVVVTNWSALLRERLGGGTKR